MRPGKLYIKIFFSFLVVLIITEILVFGLFLFTAGRSFRSRFEQYTGAKILIAKEIVEDKIKSEPDNPLTENDSLKDFILRFAETFKAKVWLAAPDGTTLLKSFNGNIPDDLSKTFEKHAKDLGYFKLYHGFRRHWEFYATIPIEIQKEEIGSLHVLFQKMEPPHPEGGFALGLVIIGIVIALLIIPVSRLITKPLKRLEHSALQIAEGDLSHRATIKSKDEIGELGRVFNRMTDKLERMIRGGRELTANISHELRSPLARIRIAEELIRERLERGDYKTLDRHLNNIQEDIGELDRLIGSILFLSKLDIQETALKLEPLNLSHLINELLERLRPAIGRKNLRVMTVLSFDHSIFGDKDALKTGLSNILNNTVKFTPENGKLSVKTYKEHGFMKISVTNSFEVLSEDELNRIFEPFYRTEQSRASGSGLGLAITKKIIERHGGSIKAVNSSEGLKIQIRLPMDLPERDI